MFIRFTPFILFYSILFRLITVLLMQIHWVQRCIVAFNALQQSESVLKDTLSYAEECLSQIFKFSNIATPTLSTSLCWFSAQKKIAFSILDSI